VVAETVMEITSISFIRSLTALYDKSIQSRLSLRMSMECGLRRTIISCKTNSNAFGSPDTE
jgi:hypothetical protein